MKKRPETLEAEARAIWGTARRLGTFSYGQLAVEAHIAIHRATQLVKGWEKQRLVEEVEPDSTATARRKFFKLTVRAEEIDLPANLVVAPLPQTPEETMWRTVRMQRAFTARDVAALSTTPDVTVTEDDAHRYLQVLLRGGYLRVVKQGSVRRSGGSLIRMHATYRLVRNTGPIPPVERRVVAVWDGNEEQFVHLAGGSIQTAGGAKC